MKRKIFLGCLLVSVCLLFFGCGVNTLKLVKDNLSEITKVYYYSEDKDMSVSISYGQREENYMTDGKSTDKVDFCLLCLNLKASSRDEIKCAKLSVDGVESDLELLLNPKNGAYMLDIERKLSGEEQIVFSFDGKAMELKPISNNFKVDYNKALEIACEKLEDKILKNKSFNDLNAECYLRVLNKDINDLSETYWCFTVFDGEDYSVIISTEDGSILAKTE